MIKNGLIPQRQKAQVIVAKRDRRGKTYLLNNLTTSGVLSVTEITKLLVSFLSNFFFTWRDMYKSHSNKSVTNKIEIILLYYWSWALTRRMGLGEYVVGSDQKPISTQLNRGHLNVSNQNEHSIIISLIWFVTLQIVVICAQSIFISNESNSNQIKSD